VRDPEVGFASKRLSKRRRCLVELELLEQGDAEIVGPIGLLVGGDGGAPLTSFRRAGEQENCQEARPETGGFQRPKNSASKGRRGPAWGTRHADVVAIPIPSAD